MTFVKFAPFKESEEWKNKTYGFCNEFFGYETGFNPKVDISSDDRNIYVVAEVPGVKKDDLKIVLENNLLTISGEKKLSETEEQKNRKRLVNEISYGSFKRSFKITEKINPDTTDAKFENGILTITIEKFVATQAGEKHIKIN